MNVLLVNIDSVIPNLALQKILVYHQNKNDIIIQMKDEKISILPLFVNQFDMIYVSCIFDYNKHFCKKWEGIAEIGGSGYSLKKQLPIEIENIKPRINLGFTTRGCIRNCHFCIVPEKEGKIRAVGDIYDIWDGQSKELLILDNNILAMPKHFSKITSQIIKENLKVDFNQGLDHRLLTDKICQELLSLPPTIKGYFRFAFDDVIYKKSVIKALKILKKHKMKPGQSRWYVYVGVKDTIETVLERINILRDDGQLVFLMRDKDKKVQNNSEFMKIYIWSSHIALYCGETFDSLATKQYFAHHKVTDKKSLFDN